MHKLPPSGQSAGNSSMGMDPCLWDGSVVPVGVFDVDENQLHYNLGRRLEST